MKSKASIVPEVNHQHVEEERRLISADEYVTSDSAAVAAVTSSGSHLSAEFDDGAVCCFVVVYWL